MLYSLEHARTFPLLLVGVLLAWLVHVEAQRLVQRVLPETKWYLQRRPGLAGYVDPFAAVGALIGSAAAGWTPPVEWGYHRGRKRPFVILLLAGPAANIIVGGLLVAAASAWIGRPTVGVQLGEWGHGLGVFYAYAEVLTVLLSYGKAALLIIALMQIVVGVLTLIPIPPLDGGRLLFLFAPRTAGWQKAEYHLAERNIGLIVVLAGLIRLSAGWRPPFAFLAEVIAHPIAVAFSHL